MYTYVPSLLDLPIPGYHRALAVANRASVNIKVHVSFWIMIVSGHVPRTGIAGLYGSSVLVF